MTTREQNYSANVCVSARQKQWGFFWFSLHQYLDWDAINQKLHGEKMIHGRISWNVRERFLAFIPGPYFYLTLTRQQGLWRAGVRYGIAFPSGIHRGKRLFGRAPWE